MPGGRRPESEEETTTPVELVTPDAFDPDRMRAAWDRILTDDRESEVVEGLKLIQPDLKSIAFLTGDASQAGSDRAGVIIGLEDGERRLPLGSYGDGIRRLLGLSLALSGCGHGYLLVDGIDTGLHWTVMENMWRLIVETARRCTVQVFATTHSLDGVLGLAEYAETHPDSAADVSIHKIRADGSNSERIDIKEIRANHNIMRG